MMEKTEMRKTRLSIRRGMLWRVGLVLLAVLVLSAIPVAAWLSYKRRIAAVAEIGNPYSIVIGAGAGEEMSFINISGIDMNNDKATYVFSVLSSSQLNYSLQLAHTTNNPFVYTLYYAHEVNSSTGDVAYLTHPDGTTLYYAKTSVTPVSGQFLNFDTTNTLESDILANNTLHEWSYAKGESDTYDFVENHGEPLYWQTASTKSISLAGSHDNPKYLYCDYYILEVTWDNATAAQLNDRETDILYITAKGGQ